VSGRKLARFIAEIMTAARERYDPPMQRPALEARLILVVGLLLGLVAL
jgi:hypothetical protein